MTSQFWALRATKKKAEEGRKSGLGRRKKGNVFARRGGNPLMREGGRSGKELRDLSGTEILSTRKQTGNHD